ncbi:MAG: hypothetical protein KY453_12065 [Gemmatimonadetes bacterium]|nr:hypothetical protein [Gemmatimonadota bacterium]
MSGTLVLVLAVAGAYLAAHVAFDWLARRFLVVSGGEYLLLGILLGPHVGGVIRPDAVGGFAPLMTLALAWIGAVVGSQFHVPSLARIPRVYYRVALTEPLLTFVLAGGAMAAVLAVVGGVGLWDVLVPAAALGAVAVASAPTGIAMAARDLPRRQALVRQLEVVTALDALVAILALGILVSVAHPGAPETVRAPTATEWVVITMGIGTVGGVLFHLFLADEESIDRLFIGLAGALILVSGAAAYIGVSVLLPAMLVGAILTNTSTHREALLESLGGVERPLYFGLLVFAGAAWNPGASGWLLPVLLFLLVRTVAKTGGARLAAAASGMLPALGPRWGRALLGQGGLAVALALDYRLMGGEAGQSIVFSAAIASVLVTDFTSARLARSVVDDFRARSESAPPGSR